LGACLTLLFWSLQASAQVRIMPLGDSITSSIDGQASYRYWLWQKLVKSGVNADFVGTQWGVGDGASGVYPDFDQDHEGHPGNTTDDILYGIADWASATQPNVVLLCIGANDFEQGQSASHALANTRQIIRTLRAVNSKVVVLWATLPPDPGYAAQTKAYNSGVLRLAPALSKTGPPVRVVNLSPNFSPSQDTVDGVHPNITGEKKIANRFYNSLMPVLRRGH
jgi:lysophospholipase L1-like esterase